MKHIPARIFILLCCRNKWPAAFLVFFLAITNLHGQKPTRTTVSGGPSITWLNRTGAQGTGCLGCGTVTYPYVNVKAADGGFFKLVIRYPLGPRWTLRTDYGMYLRRGTFEYFRHSSTPGTTYPDGIPHSGQLEQTGTSYYARGLLGAGLGIEYRLFPETGLYVFGTARPEWVLVDMSKSVYDVTNYDVKLAIGEVYNLTYSSGEEKVETQNYNISALAGAGWKEGEVFSLEAAFQYGFIRYEVYEISFKNLGIDISGCILLHGKKTGG